MKSTRGIAANTGLLDVPDGYYIYARNLIQGRLEGSTTNEKGFKNLNLTLLYPYLGHIEAADRTFIFCTNNTNTIIYRFYQDQLDIVFDDRFKSFKLGCNINNPIKGVYTKNYKNEDVIAWIDRLNDIRLLNVDNPNISDLNDLSLFSRNLIPQGTHQVTEGGNLPYGCYIPFIRYSDYEGTITDFVPFGKPIYIGTNLKGINSGKQINLLLSNLDTRFDFFQIGWLQINDDIRTATLSDRLKVATTYTYNYASVEDNETISLEELLVNSPYYVGANTIELHNKRLAIGDLTELEEVNLQQYANKIRIYGKSILVDDLLPKSSACGIEEKTSLFSNSLYGDGNIKTFAHQEVYSLYICYIIAGRRTRGFHIPGREANANDRLVTQQMNDQCLEGYKYQYEDTCAKLPNGLIELSFWENQNETYPNTTEFAELRNQKVRHHKMPSHRWCKQNLYNTNTQYGVTTLDVLSIVADNVIIPEELKDRIEGYEIYYAKRTLANTTILGQSLYLVGANINETDTVGYQSTGGNFNVDWNDGVLYVRRNIVRFHSFDLLYNKPSISGTILYNQLKLNTSKPVPNNGNLLIANDQEGTFVKNGIYALGIDKFSRVIDYTSNTQVFIPTDKAFYKRAKTGEYVPASAVSEKYTNYLGETSYILELNDTVDISISSPTLNREPFANDGKASMFSVPQEEQSYLSTLVSPKTNVYRNFYTQDLISTGQINKIGSASNIYGGDSFVSLYSFTTYGQRYVDDKVSEHGIRISRRFICETASNLALRYQDQTNVQSYFFPQSNGNWLNDLNKALDPNQFGYKKEFNQLAEYNKISPFDPYEVIVTAHIGRVAVSAEENSTVGKRSWRTFAPDDYYDVHKSKGKITDLASIDDRLIIKCEHDIMITRGFRTLGGDEEVFVKTVALFEEEPQSILNDKIGVIGGNHFIGTSVTPMGYVFVDDKLGDVYAWKGGLKKLNNGMDNFFKQYLLNKGNSPHLDNGYLLTWDQFNKRLLLTCKDSFKPFTLSYSLSSDNWVSFHDYIPQGYLRQRDNVYSLFYNRVYKHNAGDYGVYYSPNVLPFYIDIPFYAQQEGDKIEYKLDSISWNSETFPRKEEYLTATHISIYNQYQCSGRIALYNLDWLNLNYRKIGSTFHFDKFRDIINQRGDTFLSDIFSGFEIDQSKLGALFWHQKSLFKDKVCIVRIEFDNIANVEFSLQSVTVTPSISYR